LDKEDKYEEKTRLVTKNELGKIEPAEEEKVMNEEEILSPEEKIEKSANSRKKSHGKSRKK